MKIFIEKRSREVQIRSYLCLEEGKILVSLKSQNVRKV